jgi:hypothetical protein
MKPLRKGKARSELAQGLAKLIVSAPQSGEAGSTAGFTERVSQLQAAVLGGAIEAALLELKFQSLPSDKEVLATFWRLTNENLWRLTRALEASGLLDKAGA